MRVAVLGVGAMGCLFGCRLSKVAEVILVGSWAEQLEKLRSEGLEVEELDGRITRHRIEATAEVADAGPADLVLVLVKSRDTERAARQAREVLAPGGLVLTLQNGLGNLEILAAAVGADNAALGVSVQAATVVAPGKIRHAGAGPTRLARTPATEARLRQVAELFREAGLETQVVADARQLVWGKLAVNAAINPLSALLGVVNGEVEADPRSRSLLLRAAREVEAVALAQGIELAFPDAGEQARNVCRATAANRSSMLQDLARGVPTEIDVMSGAIVARGRKYRVATPVNEALWRMVRERERRPVTQEWISPLGPGEEEEIRELLEARKSEGPA
ncbi:MAG: 2-dehydropantoate 2-reductase [Acidobacteria bacterium]|nr:2-dehydropantoate 2-reductase [Acidobacteriota bacterium]